MWFEMLPSMGIIMGALALPGYAIYGIHRLWIGNAYRRNTDEYFERVMYKRDMRVNDGKVYDWKGLEGIPDKE